MNLTAGGRDIIIAFTFMINFDAGWTLHDYRAFPEGEMVDPEKISDPGNNMPPDTEMPVAAPVNIPYRPRNAWKGEVRFVDGCIEKNHDMNPFLSRIYARVCLNCEESALRKLEGVRGVPQFIARPTATSIRMTAAPGVPLAKLKKGDLSELCLRRIKETVAEIHKRGVAHCDLHNRNILVDNDEPCIIDFATAYTRGRFPVIGNMIFEYLKRLDLMRLYKVERKFFGRGNPPKMFFLYNIIKGLKR
ncbi:MAG: phosphotransferase [Deltaproteobacteria bacterium]|nr:phosphotransferase [Deltaproteobacteria bacterium]